MDELTECDSRYSNGHILIIINAYLTRDVTVTNDAVIIAKNKNVSLTFVWLELERQVRIEGVVKKVSKKASKKYFQSRPKKSQMGAWVSSQSKVIKNREVLEKSMKDLEERFKDEEVLPCPPNWGGYLVQPVLIEFWQGRRSRLHDRIRYKLTKKGKWKKERLAP